MNVGNYFKAQVRTDLFNNEYYREKSGKLENQQNKYGITIFNVSKKSNSKIR